jgi:hypothetical protein
MRTALLVSVIAALAFINLPYPDSGALTTIYPGTAHPSAAVGTGTTTGGATGVTGTSPSGSFAAQGTPLGDVTDSASVTIDAASVRHAVNKGNFGGKIMKELDVASLFSNLPYLKQITPGFWTWTQLGPKSNYRWDLHIPMAGGYEVDWGSFGFLTTGAYPWADGSSTVQVEYWQATDFRHSAAINKVAGTSAAAAVYAFRAATGTNAVGRTDVFYTRFDFKVDADTPFKSPADDPWCLASEDSSASHINWRVYLTEDMRVNVVAYGGTANSLYTPNKMRTSNAFTRGQWHTLEIYYKTASKEGAAAYYLDGVRQDLLVGLDTSTTANPDACKFMFGCASGKNAAGKVYIDAVRWHNTYVGTDPGDPNKFLGALTFDLSPITVDDFLYVAAQAGATPVLQVAVFPPNTGHDYMTPQFSADFVQYVNGTADVDYVAKAKTLDFTHSTPTDNWANLRAARGHVAPYNVKYFTMGNEPYWAEAWPRDNPGLYADTCYQHITKMKAVDPTIAVAVFMYAGGTWDQAVLTKNKDVLDWVCIQHDYSYEMGVDLQNQIPRLLGISAATSLSTKKPYISGHADSRAKLSQYLAGRADLDTMITSQDEHGFCGIYLPGTGGDLGYAIYRLGWRLETIEQGGPYAWDSDWSLITGRRYVYGVITDTPPTPSYWAYRLFYDHFGSSYLNTTTESPKYIIPSYRTGTPLFETPYISAYASLDSSGSVMKIIVINRSMDKTFPVNFTLKNFTVGASAAKVFTLGGMGKKVTDGNLSDPSNVIIRASQMPVSGPAFTYNAEPLSMTAIEVYKYPPPQVSVSYSATTAGLSWPQIPGAQSYLVQWGDSPTNPAGGTAKSPGGQAMITGTSLFFRMDPGDTLYATVTAFFPAGGVSPPSDVLYVNMPFPVADPWKPTDVTAQIIGTSLVVKWTAVSGATGYKISYGTSATGPFMKTVSSTSASKVIYPGVRGKIYIIVAAVKPDGTTGPPSDVLAVDMP